MDFTVTSGIKESDLPKWLDDAGEKYGRFPDGRINFRKADIAPVVMVTIKVGDELLMLKRGQGLADAENVWSTVNGFIDEPKSVKEIVKKEADEELGIKLEDNSIKIGKSYTVNNVKEKRRYIVFPCLVTLDQKPKMNLDWEHTNYAWTKRNEISKYEILPDLPYAIDQSLSLEQ